MTRFQDDILAMAQKAEMKIGRHEGSDCFWWEGNEFVPDYKLLEFARLLIDQEREACASICERIEPLISSSATTECADAIRARRYQSVT